MKFATLKIIARGGSIFDRRSIWVWFSARHSILIYEREWPGVWPPEVGDSFTVRVPE